MDNLSAPTPRELAQRLYNKNIEFETRHRKLAQARSPSDPNAWQQMRENYEAIILEDHTFSEQNEIEYTLWQLHYRRIEELRAHFSAALASTGSTSSKDGKSLARDRITKIRTQFKIFLSEATGFYHDLILKIRSKYGLPLGNFSDDLENQTILAKGAKESSELKQCLLSCHRCLIYLGDLARYKGLYGEGDSKTRDYVAASSYYMHAVSLWPSSGNPHHQLAILASYSGDDLVSVYRYFRSLAVDSPFSTARENLIFAFEKNRQSYSQLPGETKVSSVKTPARMTLKGRVKGDARILSKDTKVEDGSTKERECSISETYKTFCIRFVRLNGILFTRTSLETFGEVFSLVKSNLHELLSSGTREKLNFGSDAAENGLLIVRLIAILIFTVHNVNKETEGQSYAEILQRSVLLQNAFTAAFDFVGHILKRSIQLEDISSSFLLPGILVFVEWLACCPDIATGSDADEKQAAARSFFWNQCVSFLNKLMSTGFVPIDDYSDETCFFNMNKYDDEETGTRLALWEDFELRGFLPLLPAQLILNFSRKCSLGSDGTSKETKARVQRILAAGKALVNVQIDQQGIYFDKILKKFYIGEPPQVSEELMPINSLDVPNSNGMMRGHFMEKIKSMETVQPNAQLYMEGEDEDEVIVFKPTVAEKHTDAIVPNLTSFNAPEPAENTSKTEWGTYVGSVLVPPSTLYFSTTLDASPLSSTSFVSNTHQHLQSTNPSASTWLVEQQSLLSNGLKNLSFVENGLVMKPDFKEGLSVSQPPALPIPYPQSVNLSVARMLSGQKKAPESMIPSKFDYAMSSGPKFDGMMKASSVFSESLRKNSVSRPVRHYGPPPGFSSVPSKQVDESLIISKLKIDNPPMDDYSWLDGYQSSSSTKDALNNSINHTTRTYPQLNGSNDLTGAINFPFPGKQVPNAHGHVENHKGWQYYQLQEHLKLYQEQQQQDQLGNPQSTSLPEQYQGRSLWANPSVA